MPGQTLGHYRLDVQLGAGGMGVVYQATDSRLGRQVAIKLLHNSDLNNPDSRARFEREARLLASLNHPHIAAIHGLEEAGDVQFLVLEYVPGDTLAHRLARGPLPVREALEISRQVADALDAAHEAGVIHRDLKPANINITPEGTVKVLDFGLAKSTGEARQAAIGASSATVTAQMTQAGIVMGTAPYMSPEQASGKPVDRRTDIWAFGCVLYEALSGKRAFTGDTGTEILVGILDREPDWGSLPSAVPENVKRLLQRCLTKDPRSRLHDIGDARLELEDTLAGRITGPVPVLARRGLRTRVLAGVAAGLLIGTAGAGIWALKRLTPAPPPRVARLSFDLPQGTRLVFQWAGAEISFSRDSKKLIYPVNFPPPNVPHIRRLDELDGKPIPNLKGVANPLYSPDDRWFLMSDRAKGLLVKAPVDGGAAVPIAPYNMPFPGDWGTDGYIYWSDGLTSAIIRTPENGGGNEPVTQLDPEKQERAHRFARLLPGGKALLFIVGSGGMESWDDARIEAVDLATKKRKVLVQGGTFAHYSPSGHIVYARGGSLYAVAFDHRTLEVKGTPLKVVDGVLMSSTMGLAFFDISPAGDLAYATGPSEIGDRTLHWVDRQGKATPLPLPARAYLNPRLSPDGKLLAVEVEGPNHDFYFYDFARAVMSRVTNDGTSHGPIWSPDGKQIAFRTWKGGKMTLASMPSDRSRPEEMMVNAPAWQSAVSFSPDGKYLSFDQVTFNSGREDSVWILPLTGDRQPQPFLRSRFPIGAGKFSPDGKWIVYCSMESGKAEIYVQPWPGPGPKIQISSEGGMDPVWSRDGKEIFYRNAAKMMVVPVSAHTSFRAGRPQMLWEGEYTLGLSSSCGLRGVTFTSYDVSPDGQRFLMSKDNEQNAYATKIIVVVNWIEELKRIMAEAAAKKT